MEGARKADGPMVEGRMDVRPAGDHGAGLSGTSLPHHDGLEGIEGPLEGSGVKSLAACIPVLSVE